MTHKELWNEIWQYSYKSGGIAFLIAFWIVEFLRKFHLNQLWVPLFVFDSEPIITHYTYWKTIETAILYLPGLWLFIIGFEHILLYKKYWQRILSCLIFIFWLALFSLWTILLLTYKWPKWDLIYFSKDYEIHNIKWIIELKTWGITYICKRPQVFEDICLKK